MGRLADFVASHSRFTNRQGRGVMRQIAIACRAACQRLFTENAEPAAPTVEPLEGRRLLNAFHLDVAAPQSFAAGSQMQISLWSTGQPVSGNITVDWGDGTTPSSVTPVSGVTPAYHTYNVAAGSIETITATATSTLNAHATASYALQFPFGNYPASNSGATVYLPNTSPQNSVNSNGYGVAVDSTTGYTYLIESYTPSGSGPLFGVTRLTASGTPDTSFGQLVSGTTHTGTLVVPSFGGGGDTPLAVALLNSGNYDELAVAGSSAHGFAVAIIDISTAGSVIATSDYGGQTMPSGQANAVMFDSGDNVVAAGQSNGQFAAVQLYGVGLTPGEKVSAFGANGVATVSFPQNSTGSDALAIAADEGSNTNDLVLGGWASFGCSPSWCDLAVGAIDDITGGLDTTGFGSNGTCMVSVACAALGNGFNGCRGNCSVSHDSVYSLVWEDDTANGDMAAVGGTDYSGSNQFAIWELSSSGSPDTSFGPYGVEVPNVNAIAHGGAVDTVETSATDGFLYAVGSTTDPTPDIIVARINGSTGALDAGGSSGDTGFGPGGYMTLDLGTTTTNSYDVGRGVALQTDGSAVVAGYTGSTLNGGKVAVARFLQFNGLTITSGGGVGPLAAAAQPAAAGSGTFSSGPVITTPANAEGSPGAAADPLDLVLAHARRRAATRARPPGL